MIRTCKACGKEYDDKKLKLEERKIGKPGGIIFFATSLYWKCPNRRCKEKNYLPLPIEEK